MKKILCVQTWGLGDLIMMLPTLVGIRKYNSNIEISLAVGRDYLGELAKSMPIFQSIFSLNTKDKPYNILKSLINIRKDKFDAAIIGYGISPLVPFFLRFIAGIPVIVGSQRSSISSFLYTRSIREDKTRHRASLNLEICKLLFQDIELEKNFPIIIPESEKRDANLWLEKIGLINKNYLCIHPGSGSGQKWKRPSLDWIANLINKILSEYKDISIVIVTGSQDLDVLEPLRTLIRNFERVYILESLPLLSVGQILSKACCTIAGDTGIGHLSSLYNTPTLTLSGPTAFWTTYPCIASGYIITPDGIFDNSEQEKVPQRHSLLENISIDLVSKAIKNVIDPTARSEPRLPMHGDKSLKSLK